MLAEIAKKVSALPVAVHPPGGPPWSLRLQIAFLFPKLTKQQQKMMMQQRLKQLEQEQPQK
jgi:hypothetical protein